MDNQEKKQPPRKYDAAGIEQRRSLVWDYYIDGTPQTLIAKLLNVSRVTVSSDIDHLKKINQKHMRNMKTDINAMEADLGNTIKKLDSMIEKSISEVNAAQTAQDRDRFMNTFNRLVATRSKILIETGYFPKAGIEVKTNVHHSISLEQKNSKFKALDDPASRNRVLAAIEAAKELDVKEITIERPKDTN